MRTVLVLNGPNLNRPAVMGRCPDPAGNLGRQLGTSHHFAATSGVSATNSPAGQLPLDPQGGHCNWFCQQRSAGNGA
jgi:hypothetical protein